MAQINGTPPRLPTPPQDYDAIYMNQLIGILRVYFAQSDSNVSNLNTETNAVQSLIWLNTDG